MSANKTKLKSLILYILQRFNNPKLTETKLQKLLYFSDFNYFQDKGKSITGFEYRKNLFGPTIMDLPAVLKELESEGAISILLGSNYYGTPQRTFVLARADLVPESKFDESELLIIDRVNRAYIDLTPREISNLSHLDFPYLATKSMGDSIDYQMVKYREGPEEDLELDDEETKSFFISKDFSDLINQVESKISP